MTVRTDEELSHDDKIQALTDKISENLNVAINELIPHLDEFLKACVTAACCQEHGLAMAAKYLVYSAGKVGQLGSILPNEAQALYAKGYVEGNDFGKAQKNEEFEKLDDIMSAFMGDEDIMVASMEGFLDFVEKELGDDSNVPNS